MSGTPILSSRAQVVTTPAQDELHQFDAENRVRPIREIAQEIAWKHGAGPMHSLVDDISHALEDAYNLGEKRGPFVQTAFPSVTLRRAG